MLASQHVKPYNLRYWYDAERFDPLRWTVSKCRTSQQPTLAGAGLADCIGGKLALAAGPGVGNAGVPPASGASCPAWRVAPEPMITLRPKHTPSNDDAAPAPNGP